MLNAYLLVGEVLKPQGIHGEVKVKPYTDDPGRFMALTQIFVKENESYISKGIKCQRVHDGFAYIVFNNINDREAADALRGTMLYIDRKDAVALGEDEVFIADLIGCEAYDTKDNYIGRLVDVLQPGATDVYVFNTQNGTKKGTMMMPALKAAIPIIDIANRKIIINEEKLPEVAVFED